ncbi:hypothetical protein FACS1894168_0270 [Deltaproteobacteria bacterium]|nr:hypothetical protein FACS1894168_0270 [Deltaproteobacteria bacterium]
MRAAAITDNGNMFGAVNFYMACKKFDLVPIIGCVVYVTRNHFEKSSELANINHPLVLLAKNITGYRNLIKLVSLSWLEGLLYDIPRVDKPMLQKYSNEIIALSAGFNGEISSTLLGHNVFMQNGGSFDEAVTIASEYANIFPGRFYLEIQANIVQQQHILEHKLIELASATHLPLAATNDCHYLNSLDIEAYNALLCIETKNKLGKDFNHTRLAANDSYYKSPEEMSVAFAHVPSALDNTIKIAEQCSGLKLPMKTPPYHFPTCILPKSVHPEDKLCHLAHEGLQHRLPANAGTAQFTAYQERLANELAVICKHGLANYFLIAQDFITWARNHNIPVGPGRGAAPGSLTAWALRITDIDPIRHNLFFECFLNCEQNNMPYMAVDFCEHKRHEVIRYLADRYGQDCVVKLPAFGKIQARQVMRNAGLALGLSSQEIDDIVRLIPFASGMTISKAIGLSPDLQKLCDSKPNVKNLFDISRKLEGLFCCASIHAAAIVVSDKPIAEYLPLYRKENEIAVQYDGEAVEKIGLFKFDFLELRTLNLIQNTLNAITQKGETPPNLDTMPLDDPAVYKLYAEGDTEGVFQMESPGMSRYLHRFRPTAFEDIIALIALYRPRKNGILNAVIKLKHEKIHSSYLMPELEPCLKNTYGVIAYREQIMQIAQIVGNYTPDEADLLREAMNKNQPQIIQRERDKFIAQAKRNMIPASKADEIFVMIRTYSPYTVLKSHVAACSLISYYTAYLKAHFHNAFMTVLNADRQRRDTEDKTYG